VFLSITGARALSAKIADGVNEAGLQYYDDLIDELLANGITP
jgi:beta-glucosidase/6-phospho-beta-glucosidase/beta-galactosidase